MIVKLNTKYSEKELAFLKARNCEILSEIKLPKSCEVPTRMFVCGGTYIGEIRDGDGIVWAILSKFKGNYQWSECYSDLETLGDGL